MRATRPFTMRAPRRGTRLRVAVAALTAAMLARAGCALASTLNWNVTTGNFSVGTNWDTGFAPLTGDTAVIADTGASTLSTAYSARPAAVWLGDGPSTAGTLTVASGGSLSCGAMVLGYSGARGTLVLGGGTLDVPSVTDGYIGLLYFDAGTLEATAGGSQFLAGLTAAYIRAGGATIDTNGHNVTIIQPLTPDPALGSAHDGGLRKTGGGILTLAGRDSFTGATVVSAGELIVTHNNGLADGSSLAVGNPLLFGPAAADGGALAPAATPVPEPAAPLILAAGLLTAAAASCWRRLWCGRLACHTRSRASRLPYTQPGVSPAIHAAVRGCTTAGFVGYKFRQLECL